MAVALEFIDFIVPIAAIREKYPGGWEQCLKDHEVRVMCRLSLAPRPRQRPCAARLSPRGSIQALRAGWGGSLPRPKARLLAGFAGSLFMAVAVSAH